MPSAEDRNRIDNWVALAPDTRIVESTQAGDRWTTQALEDGEIRYEETEFGSDEPELSLLAAWCERQCKVPVRPPVKASVPPVDGLQRKRQG